MIRKRSRFLEMREQGRSFYSRYFIFLEAPGTGLIGITVTKKVGCAVVRNKVKRWIKEILRHHLGSIKHHSDLICIAKRCTARGTFFELEKDLVFSLNSRFKKE